MGYYGDQGVETGAPARGGQIYALQPCHGEGASDDESATGGHVRWVARAHDKSQRERD